MARQKISPWGFAGMGAMACVLFLDLGAVTLVPWWVTALLLLLWVGLFLVATRWFVPHPRRVPLLPLLGFVVWLACVLALGDRG